jgi:asparagine synthase (glutamine-hydrolysing)
MSAIAGLLCFDGKDVERRDLERAANALAPHGPDRSDTLAMGGIGFVNVLMRMTPEDQFDCQPYRGLSGAVITADVRLDNRDDLLHRIGVAPQEALAWADSRVLLTAWEKFGSEIWPTLRGPFAVAIWDPDRRVLTLARDHLGLNVVMWYRTAQFFAFATMPKGLFAFPEVPRELNEEKFADFLVLNHAEHATTVYRNIFRILPAHVAEIKMDGTMTQRCYWSTADIRPVRRPSDQAYADGLRECLDRAVRRQMRSAHPIGCCLSGGLDSSSVAVLAALALAEKNQRLATFTQVPRAGFDDKVPVGQYIDETPYVEAIRKAVGNIDANYIRSDECDDLADLEPFFTAFEGPVRNPTNLGWILAILRRARFQGRRVLLVGTYGNYTISLAGWSESVDQLLGGKVLTAYRQWRLFYQQSPLSRWASFFKLFVEALLPNWLTNWNDRRRHPHGIEPWQDSAAIRPEFAAAMGVNERAAQVGHDFLYRPRPGGRLERLLLSDYIGDWTSAEKALTGVEMRDPTADIDVLSYCFGVPAEQYLVEGVDRSLIRRAMWGLTPEIVLTNKQQGVQSADWYEQWAKRRGEIAADLLEWSTSPLVRRAIDLNRLDRALRNWPTEGWQTHKIKMEYARAFTRGVASARFLRWLESTSSN